MCGICGEIRLDKSFISKSQMTHMLEGIKSRGPDHEGIFQKDSVFLGHRRLSIIDVSSKSHQPMTDDNLKLSLVFNGVIYNYKSLRSKLEGKGYKFFSTGDTEVILKSYHHYREDCVKHLDGVFAFAILDHVKNAVFLARDRLGIKPLYYKISRESFQFASTTKSLITEGNFNIDLTSLHYQFSLHSVIPAPRTILKEINKLEPGSTITIDFNGNINQKKYYELSKISIDKTITEDDAISEIERLLFIAISKRLITSDVPVGILLSGGLDSSLIVAMAAKNKLIDIDTYSIGFPTINEEKGDEFYYSDKIAKTFKTNHHKFNISESRLFEEIDNVISYMPEPMFSQDSSAFFLLAKEVSKRHKVVLSGQGADELFGGYFWYNKMNNSKGSNIDKFINNYFDRDHADYCKTISEDYSSEDYTRKLINNLFNKQHSSLDFLDQVFRLELSTLIIDDPVKRIDSMTMSHGLEARVPFLDTDLIEFVLKIPSQKKIKNNGKYHLKKVAEKYLSSEMINREKYYFPVPPLKVIENKFYNYVKQILSSDRCMDRGLYNPDIVHKLLNEPNKHFTKLNGNKLWHLALLEKWLQINVDIA